MLLLTFLLVAGGVVNAQVSKVKGSVTSADDGYPVVGASVLVKGTTVGTITDVDGLFEINNVPSNATTLVVSFIGMTSKEVPIAANVDVTLSADTEMLDEVVVTAMGISRDKRTLGYTMQDIKAEELTQGMATDLAGAMSGKVSGLNITASSGMPGASSQITIRGVRSFSGDNTPLYVVDGMPVSTGSSGMSSNVTGSDYANRSLDIDPNDIESINILKGQAASALYGMRASNGVIIITTKSGKSANKGKPQITFTTNMTASKISTYPEIQTEYAQGASGRFNPNASTAWGPKISELPNDATYGGNTDNAYTQAYGMHQGQYYNPKRATAFGDAEAGWITPASYNNMKDFFETGVAWTNNISIAQNLGRGNYSFSLGNTDQSGIVKNTGMERYNAKMNGSLQINNLFSTGFSGNFVASKVQKQSGGNDGIMATLAGAPPSYDMKGIPSHAAGDPTTQVHFRSLTFDNPYWAVENNKFTEKAQRFFGNAYLRFELPIGETMKVDAKYQLGADAYTTTYTDMFGYGHKNGKGEIDNNTATINELNSLFTASFDWNINPDLHMNILVGNEIVNSHTTYREEYGLNFNFAGWNHMNNASSYSAAEGKYNDRTIGNFANLNVDWKNMLFLNVTGRQDRVSSMPHGNRTFFYPSVSLGFIFTELEPLKNDVLTYGKLRGSYAEVGMAGTYRPSYYTTPSYGGGFSSGTPFMYPYNSISAYTPSSTIYDPNLKPQNTISYEGGIDLGFFNGLITFEYTYSRQNVKDQIFSVPLAGSTGYGSFVTNGGKIHTNAHEFTLGVKPFDTKNFKWDVSVNFTKIDNYVDELAEGVNSIYLGGFTEPQVRAGIGYKYPVIYGTSYLRNENGDIVVDANGLPQVGEEKVIGTVSPDFQMGFNTTIELYKFRLSATLDWKKGGDMYYGTYTMMDYYGSSKRSADFRNMDQFLFELPAVKQNADGTYSPNDIYISGDDAFSYFSALNDISESFIHKSSYLKLREVSLSYPLLNTPKVGLTVSAFARNILLYSSVKGFDPEASQGTGNMSGGFERFSLPASSQFGFGCTVNF